MDNREKTDTITAEKEGIHKVRETEVTNIGVGRRNDKRINIPT
jgi:hypothetical protein